GIQAGRGSPPHRPVDRERNDAAKRGRKRMSSPAILVIGTLDTKGAEIGYVRDRIEALGATAIVLDSGILREPISGRVADISREEVALAAGSSIDAARAIGTRGEAVEIMVRGIRAVTLEL